MKFFHLTPASRLNSVLEHGLEPGHSQSSLVAIFLAGSEMTAKNYEGMKNEPCVVLQVDLPDHLLSSLTADNVELRDLLQDMDARALRRRGLFDGARWSDCTWEQSLAICDQVACTVKIPPHCLAVVPPAFEIPSQDDIVKLLKKHPLVKLDEEVSRCFLVGSFAKEQMGLGSTTALSDVDVLLEVRENPNSPETAQQMEERHRQKIMSHFAKRRLFGRHDDLHPQWCGRRVDVYFTFDADLEIRPKIELDAPVPKKVVKP
jgi:predicted nucleotidyltransferase